MGAGTDGETPHATGYCAHMAGGRPRHPETLTSAEQRVLALVREGLGNAQIALRLGVSVNTVRYHVSSMLAKLDVPNRRGGGGGGGEENKRERRGASAPRAPTHAPNA
ncbi:MAG: helix-turn-helix domain-containing protein, partial [Tepidiformaceae bacterium]